MRDVAHVHPEDSGGARKGSNDVHSMCFRFYSNSSLFRENGTGTGNISRRLLTTLPNSGSLRLYLSIRRYSDFRDQDPLDLESRSERHLCVRSYEFSSPRLRAGLVVYNSSRCHRIKLLRIRVNDRVTTLRDSPSSSRFTRNSDNLSSAPLFAVRLSW